MPRHSRRAPRPWPRASGSRKSIFQPVLLHAHKADRCAAFILRNNQVFHPAQGLRNISTDSGNFRRRQKQVGCLHRALPYLHQLLDQLRGPGRNFGYFHGDILSFVLCPKSCNNKQRGAARQPPVACYYWYKLDIENPIIRINTAFKGCSSLEKISVLPRIYHN